MVLSLLFCSSAGKLRMGRSLRSVTMGEGRGSPESGNSFQDFWREAEEPQYLGHTGKGNPQLASQANRRGAVSVFCRLFPLLGKSNRITIKPFRFWFIRFVLLLKIGKLKYHPESSIFRLVRGAFYLEICSPFLALAETISPQTSTRSSSTTKMIYER